MNRGILLLKAAIGVVGLSLVGVGGFNFISTGCPLGIGACSTTTAQVATVAADTDCPLGCDGDTAVTTLVAAESVFECSADKSASSKTQIVAAGTKSGCSWSNAAPVQTVAVETDSGGCSGTVAGVLTVAAASKCSGESLKDCTSDAAAREAKIKLIKAEGGELPGCCKDKLEQAKADNAQADETGEG